MRIISGKCRGRILRTIVGEGYRPATGKVREALFSMLEARGLVWQDLFVLDLFAGSGSLGFEALSRGASAAMFVEANKKAAELILKNAQMLGIPSSSLQVRAEVVQKFLTHSPPCQFGLVFIDPPYADNVVSSVLKLLFKYKWIREGAFVTAEISSKATSGNVPNEEIFGNEHLGLLADRFYGQTRILLWQVT